MEPKNENQITSFIRRWTLTVGYIAILLTIMLGIRIYEVFFN